MREAPPFSFFNLAERENGEKRGNSETHRPGRSRQRETEKGERDSTMSLERHWS